MMCGCFRVASFSTISLTLLLIFGSMYASAATEIQLLTTRQVNDRSQSFRHVVIIDAGRAVTLSELTTNNVVSKSRLVSNLLSDELALIEDEKRSCQRWQADEFSLALGNYIYKLTDAFDVDISEPVFTKLYEKPADPIAGYPVTESGWRLTVEIRFPLLFKKTEWFVTRELTLWQTDADLPKVNIPIRQRWLKTGFTVLDKLVEEAVAQVPGFTMQSDMQQTIESNLLDPPVLRVKQTVTAIDTEYETPPADYFHVPECQPLSKKQQKNKSKELLFLMYGKLVEH